MRYILTIMIALLTLPGFGQQMTLAKWEVESKTNNRLLPKYGGQSKTATEKKSDNDFIESIMKQEQFNGDRRAASNHMIQLGFEYIYRGDAETAMYRYNQAYLLDSTNVEVYWGYGAFFMAIGHYGEAANLYREGLSLDSNNTHLLTDYGTYFFAQYYNLSQIDPRGALSNVDSALLYMNKSYQLNPSDVNTAFKLSVGYWMKGDCDNAWKYYDACKELGGQPITEAYTTDLIDSCDRKK